MFWNIKCFLYAKRFMNDCCFLTLNTRLLNESMRDLSGSKTLINFIEIEKKSPRLKSISFDNEDVFKTPTSALVSSAFRCFAI